MELKERVKQKIRFQSKEAKSSCKKLYDLVKEKALELEREAIILKRQKNLSGKKRANDEWESKPNKKFRSTGPGKTTGQRLVQIVNERSKKKPPVSGCLACLACKGDHWLSDCPTASEEQKKRLRDSFASKRQGRPRQP
jgi:hypothetical protein